MAYRAIIGFFPSPGYLCPVVRESLKSFAFYWGESSYFGFSINELLGVKTKGVGSNAFVVSSAECGGVLFFRGYGLVV